jgi:hypothetical protein
MAVLYYHTLVTTGNETQERLKKTVKLSVKLIIINNSLYKGLRYLLSLRAVKYLLKAVSEAIRTLLQVRRCITSKNIMSHS